MFFSFFINGRCPIKQAVQLAYLCVIEALTVESKQDEQQGGIAEAKYTVKEKTFSQLYKIKPLTFPWK